MLTPSGSTMALAVRQVPRKNEGRGQGAWSQPLSLRRNFSWTVAGNVVYTGCQWGMLMVLTKLGSPEMVGQFVLGLAIATPPMSFANLKARGIQACDAKREYRFGEYLGLTFLTTGLALLVILGSTLFGGYSQETALVILAVAVGKAFDVISDVFFGLYQLNEHMDRIAKPLMVNGLLSLTALGLGVYLTGSVLWGTVGWMAAKAFTLVWYNLRSGAYVLETEMPAVGGPNADRRTALGALKPSWSPARLFKLGWLTLPLCAAAMLLQLNANIPRYFIEHYLGERELGLFAALTYLMLPGNMLAVAALGQAVMPRLAKYYSAGDTHAYVALLLRLAGLIALAGGAAVLLVLVAGRTVLTLVYTPEYAQHTDILFWVTIEAALAFISSFLAYAMTAARYFRPQAGLSGTAVVISSIACVVLIPGHGLAGAAYSMVTATLFQLAGSIVVLTRVVRVRLA